MCPYPSRSQKLPDLPQEIITDILIRLPVKPLMRFKCVSKSLLYLISSPQFNRYRLAKSSDITNYNHQRLIMIHVRALPGHSSYYRYSSSLHSIFYSPSDSNNTNSNHAVELDYPLKDLDCSISMVGSCNGLVCIVIGKVSVFIWNPSTRESKELPDLGTSLGFHSFPMLGFGYDQVNDDYKVVWTISHVGNGSLVEKRVIVYSLRTNSWGQFKNIPRDTPYHDTGIFVNGVLHWASVSISLDTIVSFDLGNEAFGEIEEPNYNDDNLRWSLGELGGCLSICCQLDAIRNDIWVMKEYRVRDSWIKLCTIPCTTTPEDRRYFYLSPLCIFTTSEILLKCGDFLLLIDPKLGTCRNPDIPNLSNPLRDFQATTYIESLVSPNHL